MGQHPILITKDVENHPELALVIAYPLLSENKSFKKACDDIVSELDQYNIKKIGHLSKRKVYCEVDGSQVEIAETYNTSILLSNHINHDILERILIAESEILTVLAAKAKSMGVKNFYGWCYQNSQLIELFKNAGFYPCGAFHDFIENRIVQRFHWNLESFDANSNIHVKSNITISNDDVGESYEDLNPYSGCNQGRQDFFGIFVYAREEQGLKGGMFGTIYHAEEKGITHGDVFCLWLDASLQGKGIGRFLMGESEKLLKERGVYYIQLVTNGFQAPGFYEKLGFRIVESCPGYYMHNNHVYSIFDCTKKLYTTHVSNCGGRQTFGIQHAHV